MIVIVVMIVVVIVVVVIVVVIVCVVNVIMSQFFFSCFVNCYNFNVEFQVLIGQYVVIINYDVIVFNCSDFNWYWILVGFSQEMYIYLQFINVYKYVFRNMLYQVFVVLIVSVVCVNSDIKFVVNFMIFQCCFQVRDQGIVIMQVVQWCIYWRFIN